MSAIDHIVRELKCAFDGEPWHGPALMELLDSVDAKTAAARPIPTAHSIWELVVHLTAWERVITRRLFGENLTLTDAENFGHATGAGDAAWRGAIENLRRTHAELISAVSALSDEKLNASVLGKPYDIRFMLHGASQHLAYHGGQIALLKRARA